MTNEQSSMCGVERDHMPFGMKRKGLDSWHGLVNGIIIMTKTQETPIQPMGTFSYFFVEMFETCYILKNSWMFIFQITLFQFIFKTAKISLADTCNQCDIERK